MKKILFQGDSITDVARNKTNPSSTNGLGSGYPLLIKARLNFEYPGEYDCVNMGMGGDRIVDLYARIKRDIINLEPDILSILIGVNGVLHDFTDTQNGVSAPKFERVYDWLLTEVQEALPQIRIIILEPFTLPGTFTQPESDPLMWSKFSYETALRAQAAKRVAEKHGATFIELQRQFDEACKRAPSSNWLREGIHPTEAGHELIAREWMKRLGLHI